ncbi:serine/threonine protein kinase KIN3 [Sugiyamaella lignohabitans]|uniref:non-specific serine/threonine protein kinase n=1 Tax=Sugiyamaella lignohabitans TaxID=796027 RepID=A0A161HIP2_9ASCO|nr:serine/threonine protein kinase KIN3 [Sugiyamaella lignohabitans]ANB11068.1 serine/threonine protein kinase KIN3 [Sugiyamaella lignohabitans]
MVRPDEFEPLEVIGRGSFGQIRKVRRITNGEILARKEISYKSMNQKEKAQLIAEFRILKSLVHPNIVQYLHHEHLVDEHIVHLYMEYCGGGDLAGLISQCRSSNTLVPENVIWGVFTQLIMALYRCHYNEDPPPVPEDLFGNDSDTPPPPNPSTVILHRDIKPDNVFLDENYSVKLGDFGLAKMLDQENRFARTYVGTPYYMSPEVLLDEPSTPSSDVWSLGCVIYELCALHPPFQAKTHMALSQKIREGAFDDIPSCYSSTLSRTITACLNTNPLQRPTTATLLRLDIIKLCRKEREILTRERELKAIEQILIEREHQMEQQLEQQRFQMEQEIEQEMYNRLEQRLAGVLEAEVEKRVEIALKSVMANNNNPNQVAVSPIDTSMLVAPSSPIPGMSTGRNVRGPRSIRDAIISPLRDMSNSQYRTTAIDSPLSYYPKNASNSNINSSNSSNSSSNNTVNVNIEGLGLSDGSGTSSTNSGSSVSSTSSTGTSSDPTANWITSKKDPQRVAPHYQAMHSSPGIGAAAAKARLLNTKGSTPGMLGRVAVQLQREAQDTTQIWDENIHGDNMPSPFLRRWERRTVS